MDLIFTLTGQALGYKMGQLKIKETRQTLLAAVTEAGKLWDIRDFHDAVLRPGALPLDLMQRAIYHEFCTKFELNKEFCPK